MVGGGGDEDCRLRDDASPSALLTAKRAMLKVVALIEGREWRRDRKGWWAQRGFNASSVLRDEHHRTIQCGAHYPTSDPRHTAADIASLNGAVPSHGLRGIRRDRGVDVGSLLSDDNQSAN